MTTPEQRAKNAAYMRGWNASNRERVNAQKLARYHANPARVLCAQRVYNARPDVKARMRDYNRAYNEQHRDTLRAQRSAYRIATREQRVEGDRAYYAKTKATQAVAKAARYRENPQVVIDRNRAWRRRHPEKILAKNQRRRAHKAGVLVEHVSPDRIYQRDGGLCGLCGAHVAREAMTLDHIAPLSLGGAHVATNLQTAHRSCNSRKGARVAATAA